ncbi:MAG: cytochrome d ubiquinol oxidase subunit II, partial [Candidatus Rhabdochlamydia oedothoracis]|nr:cytochrome d ubiquinol oxidase subunit II [Candidatus Rhabdochlamydia oedothoracis]
MFFQVFICSLLCTSRLKGPSLMLLYAIGTYPDLIISSKDPKNLSLSIFNSSSSPITLSVIFIVALAGAPLSIFYVSYVYKVFKGKVKLDPTSY